MCSTLIWMYIYVCPVIKTLCCSHPEKRWWSFDMRTLKSNCRETTYCRLSLFDFFKIQICICLKHLHARGRKDDLFSDPCYQQFGEELNKVLKDWQPSVLPDGECSHMVWYASLLNTKLLFCCFCPNSPQIWLPTKVIHYIWNHSIYSKHLKQNVQKTAKRKVRQIRSQVNLDLWSHVCLLAPTSGCWL